MEETKVDIFMTIYWGDWMRDTAHLSLQEQGAYLMLVRHYWNNRGALDDDKTRLYRSVGAQTRSEKESVNLILRTHFLHENGQYRHKRIDAEIAQAIERKNKNIKKAQGAAAARHGAPSNAPSKPQANVKQCPSPSPSPSMFNIDSSNEESSDSPKRMDYNFIIETWNKTMEGTLPTLINLSDTRKQHVRKRYFEDLGGKPEVWQAYLDRIKASDWLTARTGDGKWQANFDWVIKKSNFDKIMEGNYDNRGQQTQFGQLANIFAAAGEVDISG